MPTTYIKAPAAVIALALDIMTSKERHRALCDCKVRVDIVMASAERDEKTGEPIGDALKHRGVKALGIARKIGLKDRAMGRGDCEICLDADHWEQANDMQRDAILAHELCHFSVKMDKRGIVKDDLGRPCIVLNPHDYDHGHFVCIAKEYGRNSIEVQQITRMMELNGQYLMPGFEPKAA